ncbi:MAG: hypothetical protein CR971_02065 [candidate division SR1 bacterium]|nr:MAG: hypothetical protein CR971_02065 [candidate division SR1 bacterium]
MHIITKKDGEGFLAEVEGKENLFAFGKTEHEALQELQHVIDMMIDYHKEELTFQKSVKNFLLTKKLNYAV